jgi:steroid delta-isomerase-like uncharacterized protein
MTGPEAIAVVRAYVDAANAGDVEAMVALTAPGFVHHSGAGDLDADGLRRGFAYYKSAFPDFRYDVEELLAADDGTAVVARWTMRGTQRGPFLGAPPSGRSIAAAGISLHRVRDGKVTEDWEYSDDTGAQRQLGFRVEPPAADEGHASTSRLSTPG